MFINAWHTLQILSDDNFNYYCSSFPSISKCKKSSLQEKNPSFKDKLRKLLAGLLSLVKAVMESNAYKDLLNKGYLEYPSTKHSVSSLRLGPGLSVFFRSAID